MSIRPPLRDDLLHGYVDDGSCAGPLLYAQQILRDDLPSGVPVSQILEEMREVFSSVEMHTECSLERFPDPLNVRFQDAVPVRVNGQLIYDHLDLFEVLVAEKYRSVLVLLEKYSERVLLGALIILVCLEEIESVPLNPYRDANDHILDRCLRKILATYVFVDRGMVDWEGRYTRRAAAENAYEGRQKGAKANADAWAELQSCCVALFNKGRFSSMRQGAEMITPEVTEYDRVRTHRIKSSEPVRTVYEWIRRANREGKLYKTF